MTIRLFAQLDTSLIDVAGKKAPYITSRALNQTAMGARDRVKGGLPKRFKLRNNWTMGGIQARMSNKTNLLAQVLAPDYMAIQETGGTRTASGSRMLRAPSDELPTMGVIPENLRPRALLADKAFIIGQGADAGVFIRYGKGRGQIRLLWWLTEQQQYDQRFNFEADVEDYVQDRFSSHFLNEWAKVIGQGGYAASDKPGRKALAKAEGVGRRQHRRTR